MKLLRIATRQSLLALKQTEMVKLQLQALYPELKIEVLGITSEGDRKLESSLAKIGGKGLFIKELEHALLEGKADIAVHSMKDVPAEMSEGLVLAAILERADPRDVLITNGYQGLASLPQGAVIGTSSLRRRYQLLTQRPDLQIKLLRGNVQTRLKKLDDGQFDAIILAAAGMHRLGLQQRITEYLPIDNFIPAVGQAAIGIECCEIDNETWDLVSPLASKPTTTCITAERATSAVLGASCHTPLGVYAKLNKGKLNMQAFLANSDTNHIITAEESGLAEEAEELGEKLANNLLEQGAVIKG